MDINDDGTGFMLYCPDTVAGWKKKTNVPEASKWIIVPLLMFPSYLGHPESKWIPWLVPMVIF